MFSLSEMCRVREGNLSVLEGVLKLADGGVAFVQS